METGRLAAATTVALAVVLAAAVLAAGTDEATRDAGTAAEAQIELRKTFRPAPRSGRHPGRVGNRTVAGETETAATGPEQARTGDRLAAAASALGEFLQSSGTLRLPGVGGRSLVLQESVTPVLEVGSGRRLIVDAQGTIPPGLADEISRTWPGYAVVHPAAGSGLRSLIGSILGAAGYESVLSKSQVTFGSGVTVRVTPDFVVLRTRRDLLEGEARAISVVDREDALPPELRELAAEHRVKFVELTSDGASAGPESAPWRDPTGHVTTVGAAGVRPLVSLIASELGLETSPGGEIISRPVDGKPRSCQLSSRGESLELVLDDPDAEAGGGTRFPLAGPADLTVALGALLGHFAIPSIGPVVELHRMRERGSAPRFLISVPGWLAQTGERRLLITGVTPPEPVRLFLTREGIDLLEYRLP